MTDTDWVTIEATNRTDSYITGYAASTSPIQQAAMRPTGTRQDG